MARIKRRFTHQDDTEPTSCTPPQTKSSRRKIPQERLPLSYASPDAFQVQSSAGKSCERHMGVSKAAAEIVLCEERRVLPSQALLGSQSGQRKHTEKPHHALITHEVHSNGDNYSNLGSDRADCTSLSAEQLGLASARANPGIRVQVARLLSAAQPSNTSTAVHAKPAPHTRIAWAEPRHHARAQPTRSRPKVETLGPVRTARSARPRRLAR